ncbi:uncharacterized protein EI90DRAFT_3046173 [Cantharellus anzutake]|uniref:uncharacterized protein n=1 Tax=Cantharellus anzutake TaxID=1750568 RepID=UPI00190822A1|nr:uncharacterized protein EI90DRAFT_3046173 [Cantharellus anzutake]KAF8336557.1 hypothetical protein EI90DRAFT_3046173 [Cantharellus anzutake]
MLTQYIEVAIPPQNSGRVGTSFQVNSLPLDCCRPASCLYQLHSTVSLCETVLLYHTRFCS